MLAGCSTARSIDPAIEGYTCCNLRTADGWISIDNVQGGNDRVIPLGQKVRFDSIKNGYYVYGSIAGKEYGLNNDHAQTYGDTLTWVRRLVVKEDPARTLSSYAPETQRAIRHGRVFAGMTRNQVAMSLGYPTLKNARDLDSPSWQYRVADHDEPVVLSFDMQQILVRISGRPATVASIEMLNGHESKTSVAIKD